MAPNTNEMTSSSSLCVGESDLTDTLHAPKLQRCYDIETAFVRLTVESKNTHEQRAKANENGRCGSITGSRRIGVALSSSPIEPKTTNSRLLVSENTMPRNAEATSRRSLAPLADDQGKGKAALAELSNRSSTTSLSSLLSSRKSSVDSLDAIMGFVNRNISRPNMLSRRGAEQTQKGEKNKEWDVTTTAKATATEGKRRATRRGGRNPFLAMLNAPTLPSSELK